MPVTADGYDTLSEDQIQTALEAELRTEFGNDIDLTDSSVFTTLTEVLSAVLSENQEQSLQEVYQSAFLDTADGENLERVVALLGLQRRPAVHATGVQRFTASGKVTQDYVIQKGYTVQTAGNDPVTFETSEPTTLALFDDFEDASLGEYAGDTAEASVTSNNVYRGGQALELAATSGAHVYKTDETLEQGSVYHNHAHVVSGTVPISTFGVQDTGTDYYQIAFDEAAGEARLERISGGTVDSTLDTVSVTFTAGEYYEAELTWTIEDSIGVSIKDNTGSEVATLGATDSTYKDGYIGFKSGDATAAKQFDYATSSATSANLRAAVGGIEGNVGANSVTVQPSPTSGVDTTTNLYPVGDTSYDDLDNDQFRFGEDAETDEELRERARRTTTGGGAATHDSIVSALINDLESVTSVTVYENKTDTDNTGSGGLPPHSFEAVVFGGTDADVAEVLFETKAVTARDYSGVNGTSVTETVTADTNGQQRTIEFSRPTQVTVDFTLDLAVNENYIGDAALRNRIVRYVGGVLSDGSDTTGLGVEEDVLIDAITDEIVGADDTGVVGLDQSVDGTPISTSPSITTVDGLRVVDIGADEVATTDATDGSITINTRVV